MGVAWFAPAARSNHGAWKGLVFVVSAVVLLVLGGWYVGRPVIGSTLGGLFEENPGIINVPVVSDLLRAELGDRHRCPAGSDENEIKFVIDPGQGIAQSSRRISSHAGLLTDTLAFNYLVVSTGSTSSSRQAPTR